ncbi:MAG TPA: TetR/AcrR family transcriptional regulator [Solirubrobacterales bacterium]|jgi:AcrR family transcriptional regulator|nr:TetR/AcrR family transcriptional regulator [Solirubrobacterales bacterium]HMU25813.1 TetR/AcrR family transcriptional regulator [Solirubrobacterales bacterium]HMW45810.1 TetR/AcrR family transcriptional regulator [Solirubrobacterales bacterium]HMX70929.1 TetR/AcrR family transcriptional regulator [Solirubrobacterales bacterium]HMY24878.1 TetR/AcrR family transcriptional regulator [Solirubrobacterales bacterium]
MTIHGRRIEIIRALRELQNPRIPDEGRRDLAARDAILDSTVELVLSEGWEALTIEGIANRARVSKQTIYRWWKSKGAVLMDAVLANGFKWPAIPDTGDFEADLKGGLRSLVGEFSDASFDSLLRALLIGAQEDGKLSAELDRQVRSWITAEFAFLIESARQEGRIEAHADPELIIELLYGAVFTRWLLRTGSLDFRFADAVAEMTARALTPGRS